jgi:hypothetical protein
MRGIVDGTSTAVLAVLVPLLAVAGLVGAVWLVRRVMPATREGFDAEVASQMLGVVAALFGLLLAFVVVIQYQNFGSAQDSVERESDALAGVVRDSAAFGRDAAPVRLAVGAYVRAVVDDEWPRMRDGRDSDRAWAAVDGVYRAIQSVEPGSARATSFYDDAVSRLNDALVARRQRLAASDSGMPALMALLILVGSAVILGYAVLIGSRSFLFHALGAGSIGLVLAFSLVVLLALSYPFAGSLSIDPDPFRSGVLGQFAGRG